VADDIDKDREAGDAGGAEDGAAAQAPDPKASKKGREEPSRSKDRNVRVREQAMRKLAESRDAGSGKAKPRTAAAAGGLDTSELVDDALARASSALLKWLKANVRNLEYAGVALVLAVAGFATYDWYAGRKLEKASTALMAGVRDSQGRVASGDKSEQPDPDEALDPRPQFPSVEARREATLGAYRVAANQYASMGAGILARLGEAGTLLERRDYDGSLRAFREVLDTPLAAADADVRMNATEGVGMALEGKGDTDGAFKAYKTLEASGLQGYAGLGLYHQARVQLAKGDKEGAKALLAKAREQVATGGGSAEGPSFQHRFLSDQIRNLMAEIDPASAPASAPASGLGSLTAAQIEELKRQLERMRENTPPVGSAAPVPLPSGAPAPGEE
jgi:predicted negative regulator of RcsB-dependent stress response